MAEENKVPMFSIPPQLRYELKRKKRKQNPQCE
jgi:hypothetical protein